MKRLLTYSQNNLSIRSTMMLIWTLIFLSVRMELFAQDFAIYTPEWFRNGFADGGNDHEPWMFLVRRNSGNFGQWQKSEYDFRLSEEYIIKLAASGTTVYHVYCYKGFGFAAEKAHMDQVARAAAIAHKYGLKVDTYIQWNTMFYETFFDEVPEAEKDKWYEINNDGTPISLDYSYAPYRYRICFSNDKYMEYLKEKILRYIVEVVKTDFIHFDNFNFQHPRDVQSNPETILSFQRYLTQKYTPEKRIERFGFSSVSHIKPPMWNAELSADKLLILKDPVMQEWCDFRCWTFSTRLAECARFVRQLNKEIVIEINPEVLDRDHIWSRGINHPDLMRFSNAIWAEGTETARWGKGQIIGKFREYKVGRTLNNFILTYKNDEYAHAENLALNRTMSWVGYGIPDGITKKYLDFWQKNRDLYLPSTGLEKVAVLRSYPSLAYNMTDTYDAVFMAEQVLHQKQIPFDIIFDEQLNNLDKYSVLVLANQESLPDETISKITQFVQKGGGIVVTGNTGTYDQWRRLRQFRGFREIFGEGWLSPVAYGGTIQEEVNKKISAKLINYGKGKAIYLLTVAMNNAKEFIAGINNVSKEPFPLKVEAPEWLGVSHDRQTNREIVHLYNYNHDEPAANVILTREKFISGAWAVSPDRTGRIDLTVDHARNRSIIRVPSFPVYEVVVLEP